MIRYYEELAMNAWPSLQTVLYDGWILRFADGYTRRSNSINPIYPSTMDIDEKLDECERIYRNNGLPVIYKITDSTCPQELDSILENRGYQIAAPTSLQTVDLSKLSDSTAADIKVSYGFDGNWLASYCKLNKVDDSNIPALTKILKNIIPQKFYVTLTCDKEVVACGLGVLQDMHIGLFDIIVSSNHRRKGFGEQLILSILNLGKQNGAKTGYLQVMQDNQPAKALYSKVGFKEYYNYWYRMKE